MYEGERPRASANHLLGTFELDGIQKAPAGEASIMVCAAVSGLPRLRRLFPERHMCGASCTSLVAGESSKSPKLLDPSPSYPG